MVGPDERAFRAHAERPDFAIGEAKGQWRLISIDWPHAIVTVRARDDADWAFRLTLDGYPGQLPNAQPWDLVSGTPLPTRDWPKGGGRVATAFAPHWNASALYLPCDRLALPGHEGWLIQHPEKAWDPGRGIIHYLEIIYDLLASFDYHPALRGTEGAAA